MCRFAPAALPSVSVEPNRTLSDVVIASFDDLQLQAELGQPSKASGAAVVAHPHPLYGGTMHNPVVEVVFDALVSAGLSTVRFNFRGVGLSQGAHGGGTGEQHDVQAAIDFVAQLDSHDADSEAADIDPSQTAVADRRIILAGYSFGADVVLSCDDAQIIGWVAVAPPLQVIAADEMKAKASDKPTLIIAGTEDEFRTAESVGDQTNDWINTTVCPVEEASHFFNRQIDRDAVANAVENFASELLATSR